MTIAPISTIFISADDKGAGLQSSAWHAVQSALGDGLATAILETPARRGETPAMRDFKPNRTTPPAHVSLLRSALEDLTVEWRFALETLMNRRWNLCDNPYAKIWILPGMLIMHEDPLGWVLDAAAVSLGTGDDYDDPPNWAIVRPMPESNHAQIAALVQEPLPHAKALSRALTKAARDEGIEPIEPLRWKPVAPAPGNYDLISV